MSIVIVVCWKFLEITLSFAHFVRTFHILISHRNASSLIHLLKSYFLYKHLFYFLPLDSCTMWDIGHYILQQSSAKHC